MQRRLGRGHADYANVRIQRSTWRTNAYHNGRVQNLFLEYIVDTCHLHTLRTLKQNMETVIGKTRTIRLNQLPVATQCSLCSTDFKLDILVDYIVMSHICQRDRQLTMYYVLYKRASLCAIYNVSKCNNEIRLFIL